MISFYCQRRRRKGRFQQVRKIRNLNYICKLPKIVIVNSRFLQLPQKRSRGNQLIHRRLSKKTDRQRVRSRESDRQTVRWLWWMVFGVETGREVGRSGLTTQETRNGTSFCFIHSLRRFI